MEELCGSIQAAQCVNTHLTGILRTTYGLELSMPQ